MSAEKRGAAVLLVLWLCATACLGAAEAAKHDTSQETPTLRSRRLFQQTAAAAPDALAPDSTEAGNTTAGTVSSDVCGAWALPPPSRLASVQASNGEAPELDPEALTQTLREGTPLYNSTDGADQDVPGLFEMLTEQESHNVMAFLLNTTALNLTDRDESGPVDNWVTSLELQFPQKDAAIAWLDYQDRLAAGATSTNGTTSTLSPATVRASDVKLLNLPVVPRPPRMALATISQGATNPKKVIQVEVGPLPHPTTYKQVQLAPGINEAAWWQRPYASEATRLEEIVAEACATLEPMMLVAFDGFYYNNCTDKCLTYSFGAGFGSKPKERQVWVFFYRYVEGFYTHPVGLEILADISDDDPAKWQTSKVYLNDQVFDSATALMAAYNASSANGPPDAEGRLPLRAYRSRVPSTTEAVYSTFQHRRLMRGLPGQAIGQPGAPVQFEPYGRRFTLSRGHVEWMGWAFDISNSPSSGTGFWDIRFQGERIVYELSLQEAYAGYGGPSPMQSHTMYLDSNWGMGCDYRELVAGVDCPTNAAFLDIVITFDATAPRRMSNSLCVFELATGTPVMRHWAATTNTFDYFGGVPGSVLVVRGITAVYNYDYIQDLRLHLDGALEVQVHTSGYVQAVHYDKRTGSRYGYPMYHDVSGTIHDHMLNWKVDLDVAGRNNSLRADRVGVEQGLNKWTGEPWASKIIIPTMLTTEAAAAIYPNDTNKAGDNIGPAYLTVINENEDNSWGSARGYRVMVNREVPQLLPDNFTLTKGISWSRYKVAVTRRKEEEKSSSSQFNQAILSAPMVDFDKYINDNENITNTDLVLWITSGLLHIPGAEDAPVTPTTGTGMGFMLRPFNYHDENAAANLADMVYIPGTWLMGEDVMGQQPLNATLVDTITKPSDSLLPADLGNGRLTSINISIADAAASSLADNEVPEGAMNQAQLGRLRLLQPWVGLGPADLCLPDLDASTPQFLNDGP